MKQRFAALLDWIALGALTSAAGLLAGGLWFVDSFLTPLFLQGFGSALGISVACFAAARLAELAPFLVHAWFNSHPGANTQPSLRPQRILSLVTDSGRIADNGGDAVKTGLDNAA